MFEKHVCEQGNSKKVTILNCTMKQAGRIGTNLLAMHFAANVHEPLTKIQVHTVFYFRYFVYTKFPIDLWEEVCGWMNGLERSFILDWTLVKAMHFVQHDGNFTCPLLGRYTMNIKNISQDYFAFPPLIPSGKPYGRRSK